MNELQQQASDPKYSVWVSASAGTGKTKILTDRVLRLLISDVPFEKILCLTFTNAAAFEMQSRIRSNLAHFATLPIEDLIKELTLLLARDPLKNELQSAKNLYHKLLNSYEGINIYTIHAFCQKLLKLFAFEVKINPEFEILDDITAAEILQRIKHQIYLDPSHSGLINFFLSNFHEVTINDIFLEIIQQKGKFRRLFAGNQTSKLGTILLSDDFAALHDGAKPIDNRRALNNDARKFISEESIEEFQEAFSQFSSYDSLKQQTAQQQLQELYDKTKRLLARYSVNIAKETDQFFLTKDSAKRKNLLPKAIVTQHPELLPKLESLQQEVFKVDQHIKMQEMQHYSSALKLLARIFLGKYEAYKEQHSLLDYEDLIHRTRLLLNNEKSRNWMLYKLDGWIFHLLVDEAQDTSQEQWQIITTIIAEFDSNAKHYNSIFVVGDEKQSIFSFQGADIAFFDSVNKNLSKSNKNFKNITLDWSYRSTAEIIDIVYMTFAQIKNTTPLLFTSENPKILPFRKNQQGRVEIWPLTKGQQEFQLFWALPNEYNKAETPKTLLAEQIANFIKQQILSNKILPATNLPVKEADFMILVRKRDELVFEIINALKKYDLQVEDSDRVTLNTNLSVLDLISIAKFVLLPQDDLNLASLLKSPILGMQEEELQQLAITRDKNSLWLYLSIMPEYIHIYEKLCYFLQIYKISHCGNFFSLLVDCFDIRRILVANNGFDSNDLINELLYLSVDYANKVDSLLQNFVYWFENNIIEIKRNLEASNKIKIMTVHASKGLQAPIVILCDTNSVPTNNNNFIWNQTENASRNQEWEIYSVLQAEGRPEFFKDLKEKQQLKEMQEYIRLLYVAMTRAEDHLIICGYQTVKNLPQNCWYEVIRRTMNIYGKLQKNGIVVYETPRELNNKEKSRQDKQIDCLSTTIPDLGVAKFPEEKPQTFFFDQVVFDKIIKPTKQNYSSKSPLITLDHLEYGKIFHKILEDAAKINDFSSLLKHPFIKTLLPEFQTKIYDNITKLLNDEEFMTLTSGQLKTEVTIGINLNNEVKIGRIDLLAITQKRITIIDYKTDAKPPRETNLINPSYIDQLNFYRHTVQKLYPDKEIISKILWLENCHFMEIT